MKRNDDISISKVFLLLPPCEMLFSEQSERMAIPDANGIFL